MPRWATGDAVLRLEVGEACDRSAAAVLESTGLIGFGDMVSSLLTGDAPRSSSPVSCPLPSLAWALLNWLPIDLTLSPEFILAFGASDTRPLVVREGGTLDLLPAPVTEGRVCEAGRAGGPIDVRVPPILGRGFDSVTEGFRVFEGVPVRGVDAVEVAAESCLVGDLVGDYGTIRRYLEL